MKPSFALQNVSLRSFPLHVLLATILLFVCAGAVLAASITDYRVIREPMSDRSGRALLAIRSFACDGVPRLLVVDPATLLSYDLPADSLQSANGSGSAWLGSTRLGRALSRYSSPPHRLQNGGAVRGEAEVDGLFLTVDLCPSRRPFELELFQAAAGLSSGAPVPVAVAVTGAWLNSHPQELAYLKGEIEAARLAITWVNHSHTHHYDPKAPLKENFLLTPGTDHLAEVLELERQLLSMGLVPSPFFRFPGLVSDRATVELLAELSLIPIGSDAWLAKGEEPRPGSFILVHGNGNEPKGVQLLLPLLKNRGLRLLPLPAAFGPDPPPPCLPGGAIAAGRPLSATR